MIKLNLLTDLTRLVKQIEVDLHARCDEVPAIDELLKMEYDQARKAERTGVAFEEWRADLITQVAVAWVLSSVFVRFLEDNRLIETPKIAGVTGHSSSVTGHGEDWLQRAREEHEISGRVADAVRDWTGLSVLYICPIKALLNNLDLRLQRYCTLLGARSALWHGDVKSSARKQILREAPDGLLTTPESNVDARSQRSGDRNAGAATPRPGRDPPNPGTAREISGRVSGKALARIMHECQGRGWNGTLD